MGARAELANLLTFVTNAGIAPQIGLELPLEQAEEGFRALRGGGDRRKNSVHALRPTPPVRSPTHIRVRHFRASASTVGHRV